MKNYIVFGYMKKFKRVRRLKGKRKYIIQGKFEFDPNFFDPNFIVLDKEKGFIWRK